MLAFDMQLEIMKRLPVKLLIQCRSVCKAWKSFIDSSEFIAGYNVGHDQPQQHLMITYTVGECDELEYVCFVVDDDTFPQQKFAPNVPWLLEQLYLARIIDSSHGVLGFYGYFREPDNSATDMVVLWNPTIRKSVGVVVPNVVHWPFRSVVGFGVCPHTNDPKLVKITYIYDIGEMESISCIPCQVMVFKLSSGEWTCLSTNHQLPRKSIEFTDSKTVIGQFIYWCAYDRINVDGGYRNMIMSFDLSTQQFREVQLPDSLADLPKSDFSISRLRESLVLLKYNKYVYDVWMMEHGDSKAFTKLFTINPPNESVLWTLGFRKSGEPITETPRPLVVYEPCSQHFMDLAVRGIWYSLYGSFYVESLLLLDHDDGYIVRYGAVNR